MVAVAVHRRSALPFVTLSFILFFPSLSLQSESLSLSVLGLTFSSTTRLVALVHAVDHRRSPSLTWPSLPVTVWWVIGVLKLFLDFLGLLSVTHHLDWIQLLEKTVAAVQQV
ncbi:unnamed protein product [Citrullus colocynthis]|uniref:Uncharacterized protein n=1 Tax=Citrullus colocynthis TaxID=252529 RepID=A0ABP0YFQ2_9ROSI